MAAPRRGWFVYLIECRDGTLYTGVAVDVAARIAAHNAGRGARYTRGRGPVVEVARSRRLDRGAALRLEIQVKRLDRRHKAAAVRRGPARRASPGRRPAPASRRPTHRRSSAS